MAFFCYFLFWGPSPEASPPAFYTTSWAPGPTLSLNIPSAMKARQFIFFSLFSVRFFPFLFSFLSHLFATSVKRRCFGWLIQPPPVVRTCLRALQPPLFGYSRFPLSLFSHPAVALSLVSQLETDRRNPCVHFIDWAFFSASFACIQVCWTVKVGALPHLTNPGSVNMAHNLFFQIPSP